MHLHFGNWQEKDNQCPALAANELEQEPTLGYLDEKIEVHTPLPYAQSQYLLK
jgi:hypothetical protein